MKFIKGFLLIFVAATIFSNLDFVSAVQDMAETAPQADSLSPSSGPTGTEVAVYGKYFSTTNSVSYNSSFDAAGTISSVVATDNGTKLTFTIPPTLQKGTHKFSVFNGFGSSSYLEFNVTSTQVDMKHAQGTNVVAPDGTVYRISGGGRNPYTSAGAFTSYKFNTWAGVEVANSFDLTLPIGTYTPAGTTTSLPYYIPPRNGALILDKGTVYLITEGMRVGFANEATFKGFGYVYSNVYGGDTSFMTSLAPLNSSNQVHPNGTLINDGGTLYALSWGKRVAFPSVAVLESWGYWTSDAVPANSFDKQLPLGEVKTTRTAEEMTL